MIAEPLDQKLSTAIQNHEINLSSPQKHLSTYFIENHGWDILASRSVWAFGPDSYGPNVLMNDVIGEKKLIYSVKESMIQGFQWGTREGPLADERKPLIYYINHTITFNLNV